MGFQLAIVGAGVMAEAIARGLLSAGTFKPAQMICADPAPPRRELFETKLGIKAMEHAGAAARDAAIVLLCVKPYQMEQVLGEICTSVSPDAVFISIAAGIGSGFIAKALGETRRWRVIRAMPNTPILVGAGMVAISRGAHATDEDAALARKIFESAAKVVEVAEDKMDAVTAISGSGPAYFYFLTEQLIQAGTEMGLTPAEARTLAIQTAAGAAKILAECDNDPADQRRLVTTPNGTTHAAISRMEAAQWPAITREAVKAAARRSAELGK